MTSQPAPAAGPVSNDTIFIAVNATQTILQIGSEVQDIADSLNGLWTFFASCLVFCAGTLFRHHAAGFGMLEAGSVQEKNHRSILFKNLLDLTIAGAAFFFFGYHLAFGEKNRASALSSVFGFEIPFSLGFSEPSLGFAHVFYMFGFAVTSATIVAGGLNERTQFWAYIWLTFLLTVFVQPTIMHWLWSSEGWISAYNLASVTGNYVIDFAGSGAVHLVGGVAALQGAVCVGPRSKPPRFTRDGKVRQISGNNASVASLGVLILWFCWFGFNAGSVMLVRPLPASQCAAAKFPDACRLLGGFNVATYPVAARVIINTTISPIVACLTALVAGRIWSAGTQFCTLRKDKRYSCRQMIKTTRFDLNNILNGILSGLVVITASCPTVSPAIASVAGLCAGIVYTLGDFVLLRLKIDDPVNASVVHGFVGALGLIFASFSDPAFVEQTYRRSFPGVWVQLGMQCLGLVVIAAWSAFWSYALFGVFTRLKTNKEEQPNVLRVPLDLEEWGADLELNWGIGRTKLKRTLAQYLSRVANELPAADPLDEMNNDAYLNLPTSKAILRYVIDHYKPYFIKQQYSDDEKEDHSDQEDAIDDDAIISYSMGSKSE